MLLDVFSSHIDGSDQHVKIHRCFVSEFTWRSQPIEFLHLDLPKDWQQASYIASTIFPDLVVGARILFQDFGYQWSAELISMIGHLIRMEYVVPYRWRDTTLSCSMVKRFFPEHVQTLRLLMENPSEVLSGIEYARRACRDLATGPLNLTLLMAKAQFLYSKNRVDECFQVISSILVALPDEGGADSLNRLAELFYYQFILPDQTTTKTTETN